MNAITMPEWMAVHPYKKPRSADYAYLKIANRLHDCWRFSLAKDDFDDEVQVIVSIVVAAYFEDVVSYTNLFGAFVRKHKELYGKPLPFYNTNEGSYYEDEINKQDVLFLVWSTLEKESMGEFLNPENPRIVELASKMYEILDKEFEKVPINDYFLDYIQDTTHYKDFFAFKAMANWLCYESYLMGIENTILLAEQIENQEFDGITSIQQLEYAARSESLFSQKTGPLALPLTQWYAAMLEGMGMEKEIATINAIENHASDYFKIDHIDETYLYIIDTYETAFAVLRSSFENLSDEALQSTVVITSLVKYNGEWNANGLSIWDNHEEIYEYLIEEKENVEQARKETYEKVLKANDGSPIAYFKNVIELKEWIARTLGADREVDYSLVENKEDIVVFVSSDKEIEILPYIGCCIKDPKNPFFDADKAETKGIALLVNHYSCPSDMYQYLCENNMVPDIYINSFFGKEKGRKLVRDNSDFIARFFKWNNY